VSLSSIAVEDSLFRYLRRHNYGYFLHKYLFLMIFTDFVETEKCHKVRNFKDF